MEVSPSNLKKIAKSNSTTAMSNALVNAAAEIERLKNLEKAAEAFNFIEYMSKASRTGVTIQYIKAVDGEPSGYRVMSFHDLGGVFRTAVDAVEDANDRQGLPPLIDAPSH